MPASVSKQRVLFIAEAVTLSHVARPALLAQTLDREKYDVFFACDPRYNFLLGDLPFPVIPIKSAIPEDRLLQVLAGGEPLFDLNTLDAYVQEDVRLMRELSPGLVVGDMRQSLPVSSALCAVPHANLINAQWSPFARLPLELPVNPLAPLVGEPLAGLLVALAAPAGFALHTWPQNAVRLKYGLAPVGWDLKQVFSSGDYVLYPDIPELVPTVELPPTHRYLGPVLWSPTVALPAWWEQVPEDRPLVYVSLGSSGQQGLLGAILEALARLPVTVIAATAGHATGPVPANARVAAYVPGLEAARRARVVICNGGNLSTQQALAAGAPVLGIVSNLDQLMFMKAVRGAGAGELLREREATEGALRRMVWRMLHHEPYLLAARRIAGAMGQMDAAENFRTFVDSVFAERMSRGAASSD
jgi:UDP:flavonoid glycosyltransferase YjiC (YdhE family)